MTERRNRMTQLVNDYEDGKISLEKAIAELNKFSNRQTDSYILRNYWRSEDLESFVSRFSFDLIKDWQSIDDSKAIQLINEIKDNPEDIALEERNTMALEKRYAKPEGFLSEIDHEEDIVRVLAILKKDSVIHL